MPTLAADLEHVRLAHRAGQVEQVLAALRERRNERACAGAGPLARARGGAAPLALTRVIAGFPGQLRQLRTHLPTATSAIDTPLNPNSRSK